MMRIGFVGDYSDSVPAHRAIPLALAAGASSLGLQVEPVWLATEQIKSAEDLLPFAGLWCVPASPYHSMEGALIAIRCARERRMPFLGTCGGFQHAIIEYARNVLGWDDADHAETDPSARRAVITLLSCSLVETREPVRLLPGSKLAAAYRVPEIVEPYRCRFGVNEAFSPALFARTLRATAFDVGGAVRGAELIDHPFFVITLFQHERAALDGRLPPLVPLFLGAAAAHVVDR